LRWVGETKLLVSHWPERRLAGAISCERKGWLDATELSESCDQIPSSAKQRVARGRVLAHNGHIEL